MGCRFWYCTFWIAHKSSPRLSGSCFQIPIEAIYLLTKGWFGGFHWVLDPNYPTHRISFQASRASSPLQQKNRRINSNQRSGVGTCVSSIQSSRLGLPPALLLTSLRWTRLTSPWCNKRWCGYLNACQRGPARRKTTNSTSVSMAFLCTRATLFYNYSKL